MTITFVRLSLCRCALWKPTDGLHETYLIRGKSIDLLPNEPFPPRISLRYVIDCLTAVLWYGSSQKYCLFLFYLFDFFKIPCLSYKYIFFLAQLTILFLHLINRDRWHHLFLIIKQRLYSAGIGGA